MKATLLLTAAASVLVWTACTETEQPEPQPDPSGNPEIVISGITGNQISLPCEENHATIKYTINNPVEGGKMKAEADQEWITDINDDTYGTVTFIVLKNPDTESRNSLITLTYEYPDGYVQAQINAVQTGSTAYFTFEIPENGVTATSIRVITTSLDSEMRWYSSLAVTDDISNENFAEENRESFLQVVAAYESLLGLTINDILYYGGSNYDYTFTGLKQNTSYTPYAWGMDLEGNYTCDIQFGDAVTTGEISMTDLSFDITVDAKANKVFLDITPSDPDAYYLATTIDDTYYAMGLSDEEIMAMICSSYGPATISAYALQGNVTDYEVSGMEPGRKYYAIAWGVDLTTAMYNSPMTSVEFYTMESQPTDAYATVGLSWWDKDELAEYNPYYTFTGCDAIGAVEINLNETAVSAYYALWPGDVTTDYSEEDLFNSTLTQGYIFYKGYPAQMFFLDYSIFTVCAIAVDADGNYGELFTSVVSISKEDASDDFASFEDFYNAWIGGGYSPALSPFETPQDEHSHNTTTVHSLKSHPLPDIIKNFMLR